VVLLLSLALGLAPGAAAQTGSLPALKPTSSDFSLTGTITVGPQTVNLQGSGMLGGDQFQQTLTASAGGVPVLGVEWIQIDMSFWFKMANQAQWQMMDLATLPGGVPDIASALPGLNGFTPNGGQRTLDAVSSTQQVGKETVEGATTTAYQSTVDIAKLYTSLGTPAPQVAQLAAVSTLKLYLWVGDADGYLHQQRVVLTSKAPVNGAVVDMVVDFTITYRNFGRSVKLSAPANAVPYSPAAPPVIPPLAAPTTVPVIAPAPNPAPGMPTTGAPDPRGALALLALGLAAAASGALLRRRAT